MRKTVDYRLFMLATLFGFLGGALSSVALPQLTFAQDGVVEKIVAHEFHVVDDRGELVGVFGANPVRHKPPRWDEKGEKLLQPGEGKIVLFRSDGTIAWSSPPKGLRW